MENNQIAGRRALLQRTDGDPGLLNERIVTKPENLSLLHWASDPVLNTLGSDDPPRATKLTAPVSYLHLV